MVLRYYGLQEGYLPPLSSSTLSTTSLLSLTLDFPSLFPPVFLLFFPQLYLFIQVTIDIVEKHHKKFKLYIYIAGLFQTCWGCFLLLTLQICHIVHVWCTFFKNKFYFIFKIFLKFKFIYFNWRLITVQYYIGFNSWDTFLEMEFLGEKGCTFRVVYMYYSIVPLNLPVL